MQSLRSISPIARAIGVIGAVAVLVTTVTYAALQSQATLTENTIASATAELEVSNDDVVYDESVTGFDFEGAIPGGASSDPETFYLRNSGDVDLDISATVPTALPLTWEDSNSDPVIVDESMVDIAISCTFTSGSFTIDGDLVTMGAGDVAAVGDALPDGEDATCTATVSMDAGAFSADSATSDGFDITFTGTGV